MELLFDGDIYLTGDDRDRRFDKLWHEMTDGLLVEAASICVSGRTTEFSRTSGGLLRETFSALCQSPLGAGDYLALAERFHTLFLDQVPILQLAERNAAKRFIALVDTFYDRGRILIINAEARPSQLYPVDHGIEAFEFRRTISRLREMQSDEWLARPR
jgi:cell division protein ZapE